MRIASLLPSATEIVCALGLGDSLVGVSHECDFPPEIAGRPVLTEPKIDRAGDSTAIADAVGRLVADGLSVYRIKTDVLAQVRPDLIVTQEQCDVCAVAYRDVVEATRQFLLQAVTIVSLKPMRLDDVFDDMQRVADAAGCGPAGLSLTQRLRARLDALRSRAAVVHSRPRVACIEWMEPLMAAGNWVPELVTLCGGTYEMVPPGARSIALSWEDLQRYQPDVIVIMPCGFELLQTQRDLPRLTQRPEWKQLPAVRNRRVYAVDGNAYLNRPGPRIVESAELLAGLIQPGFFAAKIPPDSYVRVQ
ncbi:MAG TPA: cobalamin-binding protein [Candidatus Margulisiibacteriota bacterium]|nr:cobalamin-binding protein [Candidatus Margulisiibacteriota bacterium]